MRCRHLRSVIVGSILLLAGALPPDVRAAVVSVTAVPGSRPVAAGQATTLSVTWTVVRREEDQCGATVSSRSGVLRANSAAGPVVLVVPNALSQTRPCNPNIDTSGLVFSESIFIPADAVQRAHRLGASNLVYVRDFADRFSTGVVIGAATGAVNLPIVGAAAAGLSISRQALYFDDRSPMRVIGRGEGLHALAEIAFTGSGLLQATWELAGPSSTAGEPVYRPLATVREYLAAGERKVLKSPSLPTDATGLYQLRLRISAPAATLESPVIRYFVGEGSPGRGAYVQPLAAVAPASRALYSADTVFAWEGLGDAKAYRLELYRLPTSAGPALPDLGGGPSTPPPTVIAEALASPPVTGMLVPAQQTRVTLSGLARLRLEPGRGYLWRVLAIGADGAVIGATGVRELRTP